MARTNRVIGMHQSIVVGAIARKTQDRHRAMCGTMVIDFKTLETGLLLKKESLLFLVTYLNKGQAGMEKMVVATVDANGML